MFTGLVESIAKVCLAHGDAPRELGLDVPWPVESIELGDSIAIDGCCLTVVRKEPDRLYFEAAAETLRLTTLGTLQVGDVVNVERAMQLGARLGGHLVQGHVDGVAYVVNIRDEGATRYIYLRIPHDVAILSCIRGSICLAGVSLTIADLKDLILTVAIIPHTMAATTIGTWKLGTSVNIEADLVGRYLHRFWTTRQEDKL